MAKSVTVSLPDEVISRLDEESKKIGLNRSAYISMALHLKWQNEEVLNTIPQLLQLAKETRADS